MPPKKGKAKPVEEVEEDLDAEEEDDEEDADENDDDDEAYRPMELAANLQIKSSPPKKPAASKTPKKAKAKAAPEAKATAEEEEEEAPEPKKKAAGKKTASKKGKKKTASKKGRRKSVVAPAAAAAAPAESAAGSPNMKVKDAKVMPHGALNVPSSVKLASINPDTYQRLVQLNADKKLAFRYEEDGQVLEAFQPANKQAVATIYLQRISEGTSGSSGGTKGKSSKGGSKADEDVGLDQALASIVHSLSLEDESPKKGSRKK